MHVPDSAATSEFEEEDDELDILDLDSQKTL